MNKQSRSAYTSTINRIAIAMMLNQLILTLLMLISSALEMLLTAIFGDAVWVDVLCRLSECVSYMIGFLVPAALLYRMIGRAEREIYLPYGCEERLTLPQALCAIGAGLGLTNIAAYANYYLVNAFSDYSDFSQQYLWSLELDEPYQAIIYFIYAAIIPAVVEELLFREALCRTLRPYGERSAILISAALFALMHTNPEQLLYTFVAGLVLAWIYIRTDNVIFPMLLHFVNNGVSAVGDIIGAFGSEAAQETFTAAAEGVIWILAAVSVVGCVLYVRGGGTVIYPIRMKPDENGEAVEPLSAREKTVGFFSFGMVMFVVYALIIMIGYMLLSFTV